MKLIESLEQLNSSFSEPTSHFANVCKQQIEELEGFTGEQFNVVPIKLAVDGMGEVFRVQNSISTQLISAIKAKPTSKEMPNPQLDNFFAVANGLREVVPALAKLIESELDTLNGFDFDNFSLDVMFLDSCVDGMLAACELQYFVNQAIIDQHREGQRNEN